MNKIIAKRELLYSAKGDDARKPLAVIIREPQPIDESEVDFPVHPGASVCRVEIEGLPDDFIEESHGADSIQALSFAIEIDGYLKSLYKKYDIYWPSGEPYFDD